MASAGYGVRSRWACSRRLRGQAVKDSPGLGLLFGGGFAQLGAQIFGTVAACGAAFGGAYVLFTLLKLTLGVRVTPEEEIEGLDTSEHGSEAYPTHLHPIHAPSIVSMAGD